MGMMGGDTTPEYCASAPTTRAPLAEVGRRKPSRHEPAFSAALAAGMDWGELCEVRRPAIEGSERSGMRYHRVTKSPHRLAFILAVALNRSLSMHTDMLAGSQGSMP